MALQQWEVQQFEGAAVAMCNRIGVDPWRPVDPTGVASPPTWVIYATRMAEHQLMVEAMRSYGHNV